MSAPDWRDLFVEGWKYDRFANLAWLEPVVQEGTDEEKRVFRHILAASKIWVTRLDGRSMTAMPDVPATAEAIDDLTHEWIAVLPKLQYDTVIDYTNTRGEAHSCRVGDIVRHALNHGTYHRGQLRESFGARGAAFPETDFILFAFMREAGKLD